MTGKAFGPIIKIISLFF